MSSYNRLKNAAFDLPEDTFAQLCAESQGKGATISDAVAAVVAEPQKLSEALLARMLSVPKVSNPVRVTTTIAQEVRDQIEAISGVTGLSKNQVVALSLEAHFSATRER